MKNKTGSQSTGPLKQAPYKAKQGTLHHLVKKTVKGGIWSAPNDGIVIGHHDIANSVRTFEAICRRRKSRKGRRAFLDLGCGCGRIASALSQYFPNDAIDIMDRNMDYVQHAKKQPGIKIRKAYQGDALKLRTVVGKTKYDVILMQGLG